MGVQFLRPENSLDNFLFSPQLISIRFKYSEGVQLFQGGGGSKCFFGVASRSRICPLDLRMLI